MKLIDKTSPLKNLPLEIGKEDILIFDSLRFTCELIDYSYEQLCDKLLKISKGDSNKNVPAIFGYAWTIIDNASRLYDICKQLPWEKENEVIGHLYYLKDFRHTYQHLGERIKKSLLRTDTPFFGVISWVYKYPHNEEFKLYQLISGNLLAGPNAKQTVPKIKECKQELNNLFLHTVNSKAEIIKTDLEEVVKNLKKLVSDLEKRMEKHCIENNIELRDWSLRQDIILAIQNENK